MVSVILTGTGGGGRQSDRQTNIQRDKQRDQDLPSDDAIPAAPHSESRRFDSLSVLLRVCLLFSCLSVCLSDRLSVCLSVSLSFCLDIRPVQSAGE